MHKQIIISIIIFLNIYCTAQAQLLYTKEAKVRFESDAPVEKIEAETHKGLTVLDLSTGNLEWSVLINAFQFEKKLMQEHFNENYMESEKWPKAIFKGRVMDYDQLSQEWNGIKTVRIVGELTIRDVTKAVETQAQFTKDEAGYNGKSSLIVACADYGIEIPKVVRNNIAKEVEIHLEASYTPLKK